MIGLRRVWALTLFAMAMPAFAIEITPLLSYHQDGGIGTAYETDARIDAGAGLGLMVSFDRRDDLRLDLLYLGQRSFLLHETISGIAEFAVEPEARGFGGEEFQLRVRVGFEQFVLDQLD